MFLRGSAELVNGYGSQSAKSRWDLKSYVVRPLYFRDEKTEAKKMEKFVQGHSGYCLR